MSNKNKSQIKKINKNELEHEIWDRWITKKFTEIDKIWEEINIKIKKTKAIEKEINTAPIESKFYKKQWKILIKNGLKKNQQQYWELFSDSTQTIDAEELHKLLEIKKKFRNWIIDKIKNYEFIVNENYFTTKQMINREIIRKHYVSMDTANNLLEENAKYKKQNKGENNGIC